MLKNILFSYLLLYWNCQQDLSPRGNIYPPPYPPKPFYSIAPKPPPPPNLPSQCIPEHLNQHLCVQWLLRMVLLPPQYPQNPPGESAMCGSSAGANGRELRLPEYHMDYSQGQE